MNFGPTGDNATLIKRYFVNGDLDNEHLNELHQRLEDKWLGFEKHGDFDDDPVTPFNDPGIHDFKYVFAHYIIDEKEIAQLYEACNDSFQ